MKRNLSVRFAVPIVTALLVTGCCTSSPSAANRQAQGAPAVEQRTEVVAASGGVETGSQADIQLHKEEMVVGKRNVSNGGVLIRTVIQTEQLSQPVELRREEYMIERVPAGEAIAREAAAKGTLAAFQAGEIYIPLTREEPVATKRALLIEKVQLGKRIDTDRQTVSTPLRSEDVEITKVAGKAAGNYWQEPAPVTASAPADTKSLGLLREEMVVGKTSVDNGGVKVQKVVRTQVASQPVELKREEFTVDRSPVSDPTAVGADFSPKEIRLSLSREEAVVGTRIEPTEMVRVRKQIFTDTKTVDGTVRKENIEIVKLAADQTAMGGTSAASQSGTTVISELGTPKEITLTGKALCGKCQLHQTASCQEIIQVQDGEKTSNYYLVQNNVTKNFHGNVCKEAKKVTATGSISGVAFTPSKIALTK